MTRQDAKKMICAETARLIRYRTLFDEVPMTHFDAQRLSDALTELVDELIRRSGKFWEDL